MTRSFVKPATLVLLLSVLSGCIQAEHGPAEASAALVQWLPTSFSATETLIEVTPKGTLFYSGMDLEGRPSLHRSRDLGRTWDDVTPGPPDAGIGSVVPSVDPILAIDVDTGRVFFGQMYPADVCGLVHWSDDEGDRWETSPLPCMMGPPMDHPFLVTSRPRVLPTHGYPNIVHLCFNQVYATQCVRSLDGGRSWMPGSQPFAGVDPTASKGLAPGFLPGECGGLAGPIKATPDGVLLLPRGYCQRAFVARSVDDGVTWSLAEVDPRGAVNGQDPRLAVDPDAGIVHYVWIDPIGVLWMASSVDDGATWLPPFRISAEGATASLPSIAVSAHGAAAIGYLASWDLPQGYLEPEFAKDRYERPKDGVVMRAAWHAVAALVTDGTSAPSVTTTLLSDVDRPLVRGFCDPRYCPGNMSDYNGAAWAGDRALFSFVHWCPDPCLSAADVQNRDPGPAYLAVLRQRA